MALQVPLHQVANGSVGLEAPEGEAADEQKAIDAFLVRRQVLPHDRQVKVGRKDETQERADARSDQGEELAEVRDRVGDHHRQDDRGRPEANPGGFRHVRCLGDVPDREHHDREGQVQAQTQGALDEGRRPVVPHVEGDGSQRGRPEGPVPGAPEDDHEDGNDGEGGDQQVRKVLRPLAARLERQDQPDPLHAVDRDGDDVQHPPGSALWIVSLWGV